MILSTLEDAVNSETLEFMWFGEILPFEEPLRAGLIEELTKLTIMNPYCPVILLTITVYRVTDNGKAFVKRNSIPLGEW